MEKIVLSPSLLSCNFLNIYEDLKVLSACKIKYLHLDVMDGHFVNNISFGIPVIKSIAKTKNEFGFMLDTHLMISKPLKYLQNFIDAGSDMLSVHIEADDDAHECLKYIKSQNVKAGIVINPETEITKLDNVLDLCDFVLIMSVHPGFGGQKFIEDVYDKIEYIKNKTLGKNSEFKICVDGGVNKDNAQTIIEKGCNYLVAGSSVFSGDIKKNINDFYDIISKYEKGLK